MAFSIRVEGIDQVISALGSYPKKIEQQLRGELKLAAEDVRKNAIRDAPGDIGKLRQSITTVQGSGLTNSTVVQTDYGAYMEWGTKSKAIVPSELSAYAALFKGPRQSSITLNEAILAWVKRKKIAGTYSVKTRRRTGGKAQKEAEDKQVAFLIARHIAKYGVNPHPFFFKNVFATRDKLFKRVIELAGKVK